MYGAGGFARHEEKDVTYHGTGGTCNVVQEFKDAVEEARKKACGQIRNRINLVLAQHLNGTIDNEEFRKLLIICADDLLEVIKPL